jgi:hypothetical protein
MRYVRTSLPVLVAASLLAAPTAAQASYKYTATIRFAGTYSQDEFAGGVVIGHVKSKSRFSVRDARLVITVKNGAIALFPSGHTDANLAVTQSGYRPACEALRQPFTDRLAKRPTRAWITLRRKGSRATIGFGWFGESVDRRFARAVELYCVEPAGTERGGGNADEAGSAGMVTRFGVDLRVPLSSLMRGRSVTRRVAVHRTENDVVGGDGVRARLDGTYTIVLARTG